MSTDVKVLIVDDSAFARFAIIRELESAEGISVVDYARDGFEALEKIKLLKPEVVTLDVEMPKMNGLETLEKIMIECPTPVVMLSSQTGDGTEATIRALEIGAIDFFLKHSLANPVGDGNHASELIEKIFAASKAGVAAKKPPIVHDILLKSVQKSHMPSRSAENLVVIGSSTGGPKALYQVIPGLPADLQSAVLVVQHMPFGFTKSLADRMNQLSDIWVKEAENGDTINQGVVYIARGGSHLELGPDGLLTITQSPPVCGVRPSVNVTMESVARNFAGPIIGVVLTGMGNDGTRGSQLIKTRGGRILVEDSSTCVVWGMPKSVQESGLADQVLPLPLIARAIVEEIEYLTHGANYERSRVR
jgi:two-component system, chemotaxis family, protein-glutamate methylesterase/glutaminase